MDFRLAVDILVIGVSLVSFFIAGWMFFRWRLFRDYEIKDRVVQAAFSVSFMLSCAILELVIFEILDVMTDELRWIFWKGILSSMLALLVVLLPFHASYVFFREKGWSRRVSGAVSLPLLAAYLYAFWKIGDPFPVVTAASGGVSMEQGIGRVGIVGVLVIAVLSGFGAVAFPYENTEFFMRPVSQGELSAKQLQLGQTVEYILEKRKRLRLESRGERTGSAGNFGRRVRSSGLLSQLSSLWGGGGGAEDVSLRLGTEVEALSVVAQQLFIEIDELQTAAERLRFTRTLRGRAMNAAGYVLSGYCVYRIVMAAVNVLFHRVAKTDPLSRTFDLLLFYCGIELAAYWKVGLTFLMIGVMSAASLRGFLLTLTKVFRSLASSLSSNVIVLLLAEVMGMYFVSSLLLMRMSLPLEYRVAVTRVLGAIEFSFYQHWFDLLFLVSALVSLVTVTAMRLSVTPDEPVAH